MRTGPLPNPMKPGIHGVRTRWIPGTSASERTGSGVSWCFGWPAVGSEPGTRFPGWRATARRPFGVPGPVAGLGGERVAVTPAGPARLCRWIPGVRPELAADPALERFGRAVGLLSRALRPVA